MKRLSALMGAVTLIVLAFALPAQAVTPDEMLDDPVLEQRARDISAELRCLVCQNQSIDDSDADLAKDLRILVRQRLLEGSSDEEVVDYVVSRYGEFVLLNPRLSWYTLPLWAVPGLILIGGLAYLLINASRGRGLPAEGLSDQEQADLEKVLRSRDRET